MKFTVYFLLLFQSLFLFAADLSPKKAKKWIQEALHYGFDKNTTDYTKYMSEDYIEHINGKVFNFQQWVHHMNGLKEMMSSYRLHFDEIIVEKNHIAASYLETVNEFSFSRFFGSFEPIFNSNRGGQYQYGYIVPQV